MSRIPVDEASAGALPNPVQSTAVARPHHEVLVTEEGSWTAQELRDAVARAAGKLATVGVEPRNRVGLLGPANAEWVIASHALGWLGAAVVPLASGQPPAEQEKALGVARMNRVVLTGSVEPQDAATMRAFLGERVIELGSSAGADEPGERFWPWDEERAVLMTSGSTGAPRPIPLTTGQLVMSAFGSTIRLGHALNDRWLCCLPLHHIGGFSILVRAALGATTVVLHPRFVAPRVANAIDSGDITLVSLVPTMLERILEVRGDAPFPDSLRAILVGGAGVSADLIDRCRQMRAPVSLTWGMTEAASQIATRFTGDLDTDAGAGPSMPFARVTADADGILTVRGPTVRGTIRTSDVGFVDQAQRVHVQGRDDDTIVSGGENISPVEIEGVLRSHTAIRDAVVVSIPHPRWGQRPIALLVEAPEVDRPSDDELDKWCGQTLAKFKVPNHYIWVDQIPLGPLGKHPRRKALQLAKKIMPELFTEGADSAEPLDELPGDRALFEGVEVDDDVNEPRLDVETPPRATYLVAVADRCRTDSLDLDADREAISDADRFGVVRFGMHDWSAPVVARKGPLRIAENSDQELFIGLMTVLESTAKERDTGRIGLVEARGGFVDKRQVETPNSIHRAAA